MDKSDLKREIAEFKNAKAQDVARARQLAALQLACHVDLSDAQTCEAGARKHLLLRLERMIERERQRGIRKHWNYDLNRHIALKQALDGLRRGQSVPGR